MVGVMAESGGALVRSIGETGSQSGARITVGATAHLRDLREAPDLLAAWQHLADQSAETNPFFRPGFALPAAHHLSKRQPLLVTVERSDGALLGAAPVCPERIGHLAPAVRLWAHNYGPLGAPLLRSGSETEAAAGFLSGLDDEQCLVVPDLPLDGVANVALTSAAAELRRSVTHLGAYVRASVDRAFGDPRSHISRRRRKEYGRLERRLAEQGRLARASATDPDDIRIAFARFMALEAAGWKGRAKSALASSTATTQFAREAVFTRADGRVRIDSLTLDRRPIAMVVSLQEHDTLYTWKMAFDEGLSAYSPGALLMLGLPSAVFSTTDVATIDSCAAPHHPMINGLWPNRRRMATLVVGPRRKKALHALGVLSAQAETGAVAALKRLRSRVFR